MSKKLLTLEEIEAQTAVELPEREEMALINVFITNLLNNNTVTVTVQNIHVAAEICAVVTVLSSLVSTPLSCTTMA